MPERYSDRLSQCDFCERTDGHIITVDDGDVLRVVSVCPKCRAKGKHITQREE